MTDKLGQPLTAGCYIVYGHAMGRSAGLRFGKVLRVATKIPEYRTDPEDRITIQGVDAEWSHREPELLNKKSTLLFSDRTVVIDASKLPEKVFKLLEPIPLMA